MKRSAFISDLIFTFFLTSVFTLTLFRYERISLGVSVILCVLCGALAACAVGLLLQSKRKRFFLKRSDEAQKQKFLLHLVLLSDEKKTEFFKKLFSEQPPELSAQRFGKLRLVTKTNFYFLKFCFQPVTLDDVAAITRLKTGKQKTLLCLQIDEAAYDLCKRLDVDVMTGDEVYRLVKGKNALPDSYLGDVQGKKRKPKFRLWLAKRNGRRFLSGGALILLTALFSPFPYYYLVFGSALLIIAAFVRIFGYE
ncbi:MAG: hypothetical protein IKD47_02760 [Clostridia bacterium]|nr:hypothetical protein [Clostridia bacterium]